MKKNIIVAKNLSVRFPDNGNAKRMLKIIRNIDLEIPEGEIVGFVGESGSGKSVIANTFLNLNGNNKTTANELTLAGEDLLGKGKGETRPLKDSKRFWRGVRGSLITYIPQDPLNSLNPTKRIGKQIVEAFITNNKISKKEAVKQSIEMLGKFGIQDPKDAMKRYPHEFSGGMQQRVVIAIAVASNPKVIIADEPTTALDPTVQANVLALLQKINREYGTTIVLITHDISVVAKMANYIFVFYAGTILERARSLDLLGDPQHPYTWALLSAMPGDSKEQDLYEIPGTPPEFKNYPSGDPFAARNEYALKIDFIKKPPLFKYKEEHYAATWLLHPTSPKVTKKPLLVEKLAIIKKDISHK